jgi:hypothetical protein
MHRRIRAQDACSITHNLPFSLNGAIPSHLLPQNMHWLHHLQRLLLMSLFCTWNRSASGVEASHEDHGGVENDLFFSSDLREICTMALLETRELVRGGSPIVCDAERADANVSIATCGIGNDAPSEKEWIRSKYTQDSFNIAGVNLAQYKTVPPFELYEDFDIGPLVTGNEGWYDLLEYRNKLQRPSLSFYIDKVARKRWLPTQGFSVPHIFSMAYTSEVISDGLSRDEEEKLLLSKLPSRASYAAKPTHMSLLNGNWLIRHDHSAKVTRYSTSGRVLREDDGKNRSFDASVVAASLAESMRSPPDPIESWALKNVQPGYVVEELWTAHHNSNAPPDELNIFIIWGRVFVAQWNTVEGQHRWTETFIYRNGSLTTEEGTVPAWMCFDILVEIAENLGAHKDMFRVDIFVGIPASANVPENATVKERMKYLEIAVSECEIFPTTIFPTDTLSEEMARLWIAGYKMGNYVTVPNSEVPLEYKETAILSKGFGKL